MATKTETETMTYDERGLLAERVWQSDDKAQTEVMEYDARGLLVKRTVTTSE